MGLDPDSHGDKVGHQINLVEWSRPYLARGETAPVVDRALDGEFSAASMSLVLNLIRCCLQVLQRDLALLNDH